MRNRLLARRSKGKDSRRKPATERPGEVLTAGEVHKMLAVAGYGPCARRNRALIYLLWRSGLRCSEALDLFPGDVDFDRKVILVRHGKGDKARTVGLDPGIPAMLEPWLEYRRTKGLTRAAVFCTLRGRRLQSNYVRHLVARLAKKAGIEKRVHPHAFRHTFAFELANEGQPMHAIQKLMGHTSLEWTTDYVSHLGADDVARIIQERPRP